MSIQAVAWAIEHAVGVTSDGTVVDVPAQCVAVLVALANRASEDGRDAYPSVERLAWSARKSERSVQRDLDKLEELGVIRRGDQRAVFRYRPDRRPTVWDLAMECRRADFQPKPRTERDGSETARRGDVDVTPFPSGVTPATERGDVYVADGVTPASPKPSLEPSTEPVVSPKQRANAARSPLPPTAHLDPVPDVDPGPPAELGGPGHEAWKEARAQLAHRPRRPA